jgi:5-methylcytosine-specific restriction endonuclease McrA
MEVLVLNASFEPFGVIDFKKAVIMILFDKADVVTESDRMIHSPSISVNIPSVIRLKRYIKIPHNVSISPTKKGVLRRDHQICAYCGGKATTVDHIHPRSKGGKHTWQNLISACRECNQRKSDKLISDIGWKLLYEPTVPYKNRLNQFSYHRNPDWEPFIIGVSK